MEPGEEPKPTKPVPVYLMVLDDDDDNDDNGNTDICEDAGSSEEPTTSIPQPVNPRPAETLPPMSLQTSETPPPVAPRPAETLPPMSLRTSETPLPVTPRLSEIQTTVSPQTNETPPPVAPRPAETLPSMSLRTSETPPPVAPRPAETLPQVTPCRPHSKSESSEGEGTDYEEIPLDRPEYEEIPLDKIVSDPPNRRGIPLPDVPIQPLQVTAMRAVSPSRLPVKRRTIILTVILVLMSITVASIITVIVFFTRGKDIKIKWIVTCRFIFVQSIFFTCMRKGNIFRFVSIKDKLISLHFDQLQSRYPLYVIVEIQIYVYHLFMEIYIPISPNSTHNSYILFDHPYVHLIN